MPYVQCSQCTGFFWQTGTEWHNCVRWIVSKVEDDEAPLEAPALVYAVTASDAAERWALNYDMDHQMVIAGQGETFRVRVQWDGFLHDLPPNHPSRTRLAGGVFDVSGDYRPDYDIRQIHDDES